MINRVLKEGKGELRCENYQVVCPPSTHPNRKEYQVVNDIPIREVTEEYLLGLLKPYLREGVQPVQENQSKDNSRSGEEYKVVLSLLFKGKTREEIFDYMDTYSKWGEAPRQYKDMTYDKALKYFNESKKEQIKEITPQKLQVRNFSDIFKIKKDKSFVVDEVFYPKTINMVFSPPAHFKSLLTFQMLMCIATGREWLGFRTKKMPVLYCDAENNDIMIRERTEKLYNGLQMKRKKIPFYLIKGGLLIDAKKNINRPFVSAIEEIIIKHKIKFLVFDTLHRFAYYDENKSDDINLLYNEVLNYYREKYGVTILFLHHSTKPDKSNKSTYRGSGDFLGMVDTAYSIFRSHNSNKFYITCEKSRSGEREKFSGEIVFGEDTIKIIPVNEVREEETQKKDKRELSDQILKNMVMGKEYKQKDITEHLIAQDFNFGSIKETSIKQSIIRALNFLKYKELIKQNELTSKWYKVVE